VKHLHSTSFGAFTLVALGLTLMVMTGGAHAQSTATTRGEATAATEIKDVGNPIINLPGAPERTRADFHTNQAATAATVFVNPPSADVCAKAGTGVSVQVAGFGGALSNGGDASESCETRADTVNLKFTGAPAAVLKARHCQSPAMAQAYEDAGEPCPQRLRPLQPAQQSVSDDPYIARRLGR
jgi:hypothetical protein